MKKWLLLAASFAMKASVFAQWTLPVPSSTESAGFDKKSAHYLYNLEAGGFLAGGNEYGTRASISKTGDKVYLETPDDEFYYLRCYPASKNDWRYISANDNKNLWVDGNPGDGNTYQGTGTWGFQEHDGYYTFTNLNATEKFGGGNLAVVEVVNGQKGDTRLYFYNPDVANDNGDLMFDGKVYDKWVFVSDEVYEQLTQEVAAYQTSQNLYATILNAKANDETHDFSRFETVYKAKATVEEMEAAIANIKAFSALMDEYNNKTPEYEGRCDFSSVLAVYNNPDATTEELEEAKKQITVIINNYESTKATFDSPAFIEIGDGSDVAPWTREFTGDGTVGEWHTNTWSTEANDGGDGTDMLTPFCEDWIASGGTLSDQKIFQNFYATPGLYKLTMDIRAYSEAGALDQFKGISMFFGDEVIDLQSQVNMYVKNGKSVLWKADPYFSIVAIVKNAGDIQFGINIKDANFNWVAFKNTSLTYYGNEDVDKNAITLLKQANYFDLYDQDNNIANPELIKAYDELVLAFDKVTTRDEFMTTLAAFNAAKQVLDENAQAFKELKDKYDAWSNTIDEKDELAGDEWGKVCDFFGNTEEIEGFPTPTIRAIIEGEDRNLTTEQVKEYIKTVTELFNHALASAIVPGTDCTDMLTNASFANGFEGWSIGGGNKAYTVTGDYGTNNVEVWNNSVECSQTITNVPNGIYSLTGQIYERRGDGEAAKSFLYMNQFKFPIQHIKDDPMTEDKAENKINCFATKDDGGTDYPADSRYTDGDGNLCFVPNSQEGAAYAFAAGRYYQKFYGLVEDGKLTIGITANGEHMDWVVWANFKLVYEGKEEEAVSSILGTYLDNLNNAFNDNLDNLTAEEFNKYDKLYKDASEALDNRDADKMFDYISVVAASTDEILAKASVIKDVASVMSSLNDEISVLEGAGYLLEDAPEAQAAYKEWADLYNGDNFYATKTAEELEAFAARGREIIEMMKKFLGEKNLAEALKDINFAAATDEEPVNVTAAIVNNSFEDGTNGWEVVRGGDTDAKDNSNSTYTIEFPEEYEELAGNYVFNTWAGSIPAGGLPVSQDIYGLPAGTYTVKAILASDANNVVTLYANEFSADYKMEGSKSHATEAELKFYISKEDAKLTLMVNSKSWFKCDCFQLFYHGEANTTAIDEVAAEPATNAEPAAIYNISGVRVSALTKGINIVKMADGKVKKVIVK